MSVHEHFEKSIDFIRPYCKENTIQKLQSLENVLEDDEARIEFIRLIYDIAKYCKPEEIDQKIYHATLDLEMHIAYKGLAQPIHMEMMPKSPINSNNLPIRKVSLFNSFKIIFAIMFLVCLLEMSHEYYQFIRFSGMVFFSSLAYKAFQRNDKLYLPIWLISAILINPLIKIALGRTIFSIIDVIWAIILIVSLKSEKISTAQA